MRYYLIICKSVTHAQRTLRVLAKNGIPGSMLRVPKTLADTGCGYAVRIRETDLVLALKILNRERMNPTKIFVSDGLAYREVKDGIS